MPEKYMEQADPETTGKGIRPLSLVLIIIIAGTLTVGLSYLLFAHYLFPKEFKPVELAAREEHVLETKLRAIGIDSPKHDTEAPPLRPEPYSEAGAIREIAFTQRELNAMLAKNTDLARKLAIHLDDDLVSAKLLIPLDEDFPILGGKILRIHTGAELAFREGRPVVALKGVSVMGVPIPNAWLGNMKNVDLVQEFGDAEGFWKAFADGVEHIHVEQGHMIVRLKE